jgi:hypothetical protein
MKSGGVLDQQVLQAALGKRQPRQRMWGLLGLAVLGVALMLHVSRMEEALARIQRMSSAVSVARARCSAGRGALSGSTIRTAAVVSRTKADRRLPGPVVYEDP